MNINHDEILKICKQKLKYFNYSSRTIEMYSHYIKKFIIKTDKYIQHLVSSDFQLYLDNYVFSSVSQQNQIINAIKFFMYKAGWYDREIIQVSQWFPSSKLCSCCGYKNDDLTLKDREWICPECKTHHDRDLNAAINIRNEGERIKIGLSSPELSAKPIFCEAEITHQESKTQVPRGMMKKNVKIMEFH